MVAKSHLSDQQMARCAEAILENKFPLLPHNCRQHLKNCPACTSMVLMVAQITHDHENPEEKRDVLPYHFMAFLPCFLKGIEKK
jgi:predicted anti-sigma-YlaC factor YlaD